MTRNPHPAAARWLAALLLAFACVVLPVSALQATGNETTNSRVCLPTAGTEAIVDVEAVAASSLVCEPGDIDLDAKLNVIRIEVAEGTTPRHLISRTAKFSAMIVGVETADDIVWSRHDFETITATFFDRQFAVPLPRHQGQAVAVIVAVEGATQRTIFDHARLEEQLPGTSRPELAMLLVGALFTGLMLMPVLFDLVFYRVLREKFILWHAALVLSLGSQLVCSFGLYAAVLDVPLPVVRVITIGSFNLMVVAGIMFSVQFIEPDKLPRRLARATIAVMVVFTGLSLVHMMGIEALGRWPATLYFGFGAPACLVFFAMLVAAWRNGSRTVRFLIVGIGPLILVALTRAVTFIVPGLPTVDANELLLVATIIEVVATALGVASRFLDLKLERDRFHAKMDMLEGAADHDALTGLLNRRALDLRFDQLRASGFDTFALIDLDRFKDINDRFGHQIGDAVLEACANALREGEARECVPIRLGGEEFVLLLRGERATQRAEALRQAIPLRIAADVPELDRLVTASMGVLEMPRGASDMMQFEEIYARADKLLYEAKTAGRNRMMYERLQLFGFPESPPSRASA